MGTKLRDDWSEDESKINEIIREMRSQGVKFLEIAKRLNKEQLYSRGGYTWTSANVNGYAIKFGVLPRSINTSAGAAGSTGGTPRRYSRYNGRAVSRTSATRSRSGTLSDRDVEEIMTSNLETGLKLKVIKIVAISR